MSDERRLGEKLAGDYDYFDLETKLIHIQGIIVTAQEALDNQYFIVENAPHVAFTLRYVAEKLGEFSQECIDLILKGRKAAAETDQSKKAS